MHTCVTPRLNDQNFAVKPFTHNLLMPSVVWFDLDFIKISFSVINCTNVQLQLVLHVSFWCQIWFWSSKRQNNCSHISRWTLTEAAQLYLILHQSCFRVKSDHQDLMRSVYIFISWITLCLDHLNIILRRHIIGDIERRLIIISFYVGICCTVINISQIHLTFCQYKYQHILASK